MTPITRQLRQGITPEKIAFTLALGFMLSIFPILGATTLLCGLAGVLFRLNQPLIQLVNYLAYPIQIVLLIPFYRAGEHLLGRAPVPLHISRLLERFRADVGQFFKDFGMIAVGGILVWLLAAPIVIGGGYGMLRPALRALSARLQKPVPDVSIGAP